MFDSVFNAPHSLLQRSQELRPRSPDGDQLRWRYLTLTIAAIAVVLVLMIVVSTGVRVW